MLGRLRLLLWGLKAFSWFEAPEQVAAKGFAERNCLITHGSHFEAAAATYVVCCFEHSCYSDFSGCISLDRMFAHFGVTIAMMCPAV
jgi:hypothetical protein